MVEVFTNDYIFYEIAIYCQACMFWIKSICTQLFVIERDETDIQLLEPHNHPVNTSEPIVKVDKYPTIAALASVYTTRPLQL